MNKVNELIEGYFEGTLSQDEETALKVFLASEEGKGPEYDEVRAVMGYFAAGRSVEILRSRSLSQNDRKHARNDRPKRRKSPAPAPGRP